MDITIKPIPGLEDRYSVSSDGRIYSHINNRFLKPGLNNGWYIQVVLIGADGHRNVRRIHRLVANAFLDKPSGSKLDVNHKNGIKSDNRASNLEWCSRSENVKHSYRCLTRNVSKGTTHPKSKMVIDYRTGIFYECTREAAEARGIKRSTLKNYCRNGLHDLAFC